MRVQTMHRGSPRALTVAASLPAARTILWLSGLGLLLAAWLTAWTQAHAERPVPRAARMLPAGAPDEPQSIWVAEAWDGIGTWRSGAALLRCPDRGLILDMIRDHRHSTTEKWRRVLADAIYYESRRAEVDPLLVASIVATESSFKSRIVSHKGAVGLMQLRPWVARDVAQRNRLEWSGTSTLHSPTLNVRLGIRYYQELVDRFDGDAQVALTAYNYGPTRVGHQMRKGTYAGSDYARDIIERYSRLQHDRRGAA